MHSTMYQNILSKPSLLLPQSSLNSSYKYHVTCKGLFRIAPSGAKSFIKEPYAGCILQKEIFRKSFILSKNPCEDNDSIVADHRFTIEK